MTVEIERLKDLKSDEIRVVYVNAVLMPNGELIFEGQTLKWVRTDEDLHLIFVNQKNKGVDMLVIDDVGVFDRIVKSLNGIDKSLVEINQRTQGLDDTLSTSLDNIDENVSKIDITIASRLRQLDESLIKRLLGVENVLSDILKVLGSEK
jgi:hypothetical protein